MGRIFGTDGARGVVGEALSTELAVNIGRAAAQVLASECGHRPTVLIGKDTRISGDLLEAAVSAGLCSVGADVVLLGVVPTPAVAYLTRLYKADAGVMLSASHNPYEFNGIKLFGPDGFKLTDAEENSIEAIILEDAEPYAVKKNGDIGRVSRCDKGAQDYVNFISSFYEGGFTGKLLVDCANGSASATARQLFAQLGVSADLLHDQPNGVNINADCGSTHVERLCTQVVQGGYSMGLAFDGDADRLLAVDDKGNVLDGDFLLAVLQQWLTAKNTLKKNAVVVTSMSNLGFFNLMESRGVTAEATQVGDRYVLECMRREGYSLGGEQSGHIILLDWASTGDGQQSAVALLNALVSANKPLSELAGALTRYPQTMLNVHASPSMKKALDAHPVVTAQIESWQTIFGTRGRVIVRASGTEPYIRVMVEGEHMEQITEAATEIATAIREHLL